MDQATQSLTSLPTSPNEERASRMVMYMITMGLRVVCLFLCFVVPGWWVLIPVAGVIVLPAVAVMLANVVNAPGSRRAAQPTQHVPSLTSLP